MKPNDGKRSIGRKGASRGKGDVQKNLVKERAKNKNLTVYVSLFRERH